MVIKIFKSKKTFKNIWSTVNTSTDTKGENENK